MPVKGKAFPAASWRGDILMGSGTPNHANDPVVSGVWRPKDRNNYFVDDPGANVACVGAYTRGIEGVSELIGHYATGAVSPTCMLTSSYHIRPADLTAQEASRTWTRPYSNRFRSFETTAKSS